MKLEGASGEIINSTDGMLNVHSVMHRNIAHSSEAGNAYMWNASVDVGADENVIWLRNDSSEHDLLIEWMSISCSASAVVEIFVGSGTTPTPGTTVTGVNMNVGCGDVAEATCYHTETSVDAGAGLTLLTSHQCGVTAKEKIDYDGALRLGYKKEVAVNVVTDIALTTVTILGFFEADH